LILHVKTGRVNLKPFKILFLKYFEVGKFYHFGEKEG